MGSFCGGGDELSQAAIRKPVLQIDLDVFPALTARFTHAPPLQVADRNLEGEMRLRFTLELEVS